MTGNHGEEDVEERLSNLQFLIEEAGIRDSKILAERLGIQQQSLIRWLYKNAPEYLPDLVWVDRYGNERKYGE